VIAVDQIIHPSVNLPEQRATRGAIKLQIELSFVSKSLEY